MDSLPKVILLIQFTIYTLTVCNIETVSREILMPYYFACIKCTDKTVVKMNSNVNVCTSFVVSISASVISIEFTYSWDIFPSPGNFLPKISDKY